MTRSIKRRGLLSCAALAAALLVLCTSWADEPRTYNILAQDLGSALREFARQSNREILFSTEVVKDKVTAGISGAASADTALAQLLAGTGLVASTTSSGQILISRADAKEVSAAKDPQGAPNGASNGPGQYGQSSARESDSLMRLDEVVVTAQKREERLLDVPISVVAVTADELEKRRVTTMDDLPLVAPGLGILNSGANRVIELRGISNSTGTSSSIGLYVDEADVTLGAAAAQINPNTYDLERVEVLRGPQGTLYGEGSAGGTVRFITKAPNLSNFAFDSDVAALFTQNGAPSRHVNAVVNVPLVEQQFGLRIASTFNRNGGWIDQPLADRKDINGQDLANVRIKGLWKPNSQFTASAMIVLNRDERSMDASDPDSSGNWTQVFGFTTTPRVKNDYDLYNITLTYDTPIAGILDTTSYVSSASPIWNEGFTYQYTPPGTPPLMYYTPHEIINDDLFTEELRVSSSGSGPWQWTVGGFYRHYRDSLDLPVQFFGVADPSGALPEPYPYSITTLFRSWSAFADTSYRLWDRLTVGAGVRYFLDKQETTDFVLSTQQAANFNSTDPRVYAQYKLTGSANLYASAAKGFRSGGFNGYGQPAFNPEDVWTYEIGTKMSLLEGRLHFDGDLFLTNYTNYQNYGLVPGQAGNSYVFDVGRARIKGVELDVAWHPVDQWNVDLRGDYLTSRFTEINSTQTAYEVGDQLDNVPKYQFTASVQRNLRWVSKPGFVRVDYSQQGKKTLRNRNIFGPTPWFLDESDTIHMLNAAASVDTSDVLTLSIFAQNLLNDQGFLTPAHKWQSGGVRSRPRTFGVEFAVMLR